MGHRSQNVTHCQLRPSRISAAWLGLWLSNLESYSVFMATVRVLELHFGLLGLGTTKNQGQLKDLG